MLQCCISAGRVTDRPPLPGSQVPVLVDGELEITESPVVAEYILNKFGPSTGGWDASASGCW